MMLEEVLNGRNSQVLFDADVPSKQAAESWPLWRARVNDHQQDEIFCYLALFTAATRPG
jgi:hypothetical protein